MAGPAARCERVVGDAEDAERVDIVVSAWLDEPRARVQDRLAAGEVTVDGQAVAKSRRLRAGERVRVAAAAPAAPAPPPPPVPVRYADEHLLVVAKPAGMVVHAGAGRPGATLVDALTAMDLPLAPAGGAQRPGIVHRLDRDTSGLLLVAKTDVAYRALVAGFQRHEVERGYLGLVDGIPEPLRATIDAPIARSLTNRTRFRVDAAGRRAVSHYDVTEAFGQAAVVSVRLETGRTHQVRVHLSAVGHPIVGDRTYGASAALAARLGLPRPALHARSLGFRHPLSGEQVTLDEPPPDDLRCVLESLRAGGTAG